MAYPYAARVDRAFALEFSAFLSTRLVSPNGRSNSTHLKMKGQDFVLDAVRALFEWAADPDRGHLLPEGFRNPFRRQIIERRRVAKDMAGEPDITITMAAEFLRVCDDWQLRVFSLLALYGLRPSELHFLFHEQMDHQFLNVNCIESLEHMTKGRRNKRLPLLPEVSALLWPSAHPFAQGLLFCRRPSSDCIKKRSFDTSLAGLATEFARRCEKDRAMGAGERVVIRDRLLQEAEGLTYKKIQGEFARISKMLGWPVEATIKDFRHACNTALANGGMPEHERRYLLGQNPGRGAIVTYTHLNKTAEHYQAAAARELAPLIEVLRSRAVKGHPTPMTPVGWPDTVTPTASSVGLG